MMESTSIRTGVFGASGYTGFELIKLLSRHPAASICFATSSSSAGRRLDSLYPAGPALTLVAPEDAPLDEVDVVFLCLPHARAAPTAVTALEHGVRVIDLSADFRLRSAAIYSEWYGVEHPAPHLLGEAIYGLAEYAREGLPGARLVANPGCYPTSILLALGPIMEADLVAGTIIADSKSGVSGAGRSPKQNTHFVEVADNFSPYKIGRAHRHLPEIEQGLRFWHPHPPPIIFSPHLLPVPRGILSTIYVPLRESSTEPVIRAVYQKAFAGEPFIRLLPAGELATLAHVNFTNQCVIGLNLSAGILILTSAIDNLVKGAAGQAVQNMNLMFGLQETVGLI